MDPAQAEKDLGTEGAALLKQRDLAKPGLCNFITSSKKRNAFDLKGLNLTKWDHVIAIYFASE